MAPENLKRAMAGLLVLTGVLHLIVALTGNVGDLKFGLTLFGIAYFLLGLFVYPGKATAVRVAMVMTALGLGLGSLNFIKNGGPPSLYVMFAIDVAVLALGGMWLMKSKSSTS